jgi:hypothetical protein
MLPWLFAVLLAVNVTLFWWGRQHEVPIEPQLPPLAEAPHPIHLLAKGPGSDALLAPARDTAEPPVPPAEILAQPDEIVPPDAVPAPQPEQALPRIEAGTSVPDGGTPSPAPAVADRPESLAPDEPVPEPPSGSVSDPNPSAVQGPETAPDSRTAPDIETAVPAAAATAAAAATEGKKRKAKRRSRKPPPAEPVEQPPGFQ